MFLCFGVGIVLYIFFGWCFGFIASLICVLLWFVFSFCCFVCLFSFFFGCVNVSLCMFSFGADGVYEFCLCCIVDVYSVFVLLLFFL